MQYDFNWECAISKDAEQEFVESLSDDLDRFLSELRDVQSVSVRLNWSPDDVYNEVIVGEVWCGDALLGQVRGTTQRLDWWPNVD